VGKILLSTEICFSRTGWVTVSMYRFVCLRLQGEINVTVYVDVCLRNRMREILLCTMMCI